MPSPQKSGLGSTSFLPTKNISNLSENDFSKFESQVTAPRNPKLIDDAGFLKERITPSVYMQIMSMDTKQKLAKTYNMHLPRIIELLDMSETTHQKVSYVDVEKAMFQPFPSEIYFQSYKPFDTYEVPLHLRNSDKVPRLVKIVQSDSPFFKVISPEDVSHKVAPGMASVFKIKFTPEDRKDYHHQLVCVTEREKFVVPIYCIGARAIIDFPDEVYFGTCPVKYPKSKVLFLRNVGNLESKCSVLVSKPFSVSTKTIILPVGGTTQLTLEFQAEKVGNHQKDLVLQYNTGESVCVALHGAAVDANVRLDKSSFRIDNTYMFMANQRTLTIHNRSDVLAHFKWSSYATKSEEDFQKRRYCGEVDQEKLQEEEKFLRECVEDPTLRDRLSILSRSYKNRKNSIMEDPLLVADEVFKIFPLRGEIWPNSSMEVTVVFKPTEVKSYQKSIFCEITGRESRLPLKIRGDGVGPKLAFSFDSIDIGNVFISSTHTYEVVLINKGEMDAMFTLAPDISPDSRFHEFQFDPTESILLPGGHQAINITFASKNVGKFTQDFYFTVDGTPDILKLTIKGSVIGPTFNFNVPLLHFGNVSYGFNHTRICSLVNTSLVPMTFVLRIPEDGIGEPSICSLSDIRSNLLGEISSLKSINVPREFDITPAQGTIRPQSKVNIYVTLCSNTLKKYDCAMVVDVKGVGQQLLALPIYARSVVPSIQMFTPVLDFQRCFINFAYQLKAKLVNETDLCAKYDLLPQSCGDTSAISFSSPRPKGVIEPHAAAEVPIVMLVHSLGEHEATARFTIFGSPERALSCKLTCTGEGPVVHVTPAKINWDQVQVLSASSKTIKLSNESLIPADFVAQMTRKDSVWQVEPQQGTVPAESVLHLTLTAVLDDCIKFQDKLYVSFTDGATITIPVEGHGFGNTIVIEPPLYPSLSLGPHFAQTKCSRKFTVTNHGRRRQTLTWSTEGFNKQKIRKALNVNKLKDMKYRTFVKFEVDVQGLPESARALQPVFALNPPRVSLEPGDSSWFTLEGYSETPQKVSETLLCHSVIGKAYAKEMILKAVVSAEFISPVLELSRNSIEFCVNKSPDDATPLTEQTKSFLVRNVSSLPVTCMLRVDYPFQLLGSDGGATCLLMVNMCTGQDLHITVVFDPTFKDDLVSRVADGQVRITYQEHPHSDFLTLHGEVNFPNLKFDKSEIDFNCILNDTEVTKCLNITNTSPLPVRYKWSFLVEGQQNICYMGQIPDPKPLPTETHFGSSPECKGSTESLISVSTLKEVASTSNLDTSNVEVVVTEEGEEEEHPLSSEEINREIETEESEKKQAIVNKCHSDLEENLQLGNSADGLKQSSSKEAEVSVEEVVEDNEYRRALSRVSSRHQPSHPNHMRLEDLPLLPWLEPGHNHIPEGVEQFFDILPLYGTLEPRENQRVTFTYYGHADLSCKTKAVCDVQGGPSYEVQLHGEASLIEYKFNTCIVNFGKQMFDQVADGILKLENIGRVGFYFTGTSGLGDDVSAPGIPALLPSSSFVPAFSEIVLHVNYLPGIPEKFHKSFEIQIAHFEPTIINIFGEGVFPRLSLDLPRFSENEESYTTLLKEAKENLEHETARQDHLNISVSTAEQNKDVEDTLNRIIENIPSVQDIEMEVERLILKEFAVENQDIFSSASVPAPSCGVKHKRKKFPRVRLTDYVLDFGYVILGDIKSHVIRATNTSHFAVSFSADRTSLQHTGFSVELDRVKQLPGHPDHETVDFKVTFDPRGANLGIGLAEAVVPINIVSGPQLCIRLRAHVAIPDLSVSADVVNFDAVQCGQCKVITVQLHNYQKVRCEWASIKTTSSQSLINKHLPMHLRRKRRKDNKLKPSDFEILPSNGFLSPGQRINVQIKFMPSEMKSYSQKLHISIAQSTSRVSITCRGEGQELLLKFEPSVVEFGPILPLGTADEANVTVKNPTAFPIEFYSLNFDKQYLFEEKVLRIMKGYDETGNLLLPPRRAGNELPPELIQYYQEQEEKKPEGQQKQDIREETKSEGLEELAEGVEVSTEEKYAVDVKEENGNTVEIESTSNETNKKKLETEDLGKSPLETGHDSRTAVGELELTPVAAVIARHLGIDLSPEGRSARNRRGIIVIVHGPPGSGKTSTAELLAKTYGAATMTIDSIVLDAICNGSTQASSSVKELVDNRGIGDVISRHVDIKLSPAKKATCVLKSGLKARELCAFTAKKALREEETETAPSMLVGISVEAVATPTGPSAAVVPENKLGVGATVPIPQFNKKSSFLSKHTHSTVTSKVAAPVVVPPPVTENTGSNVSGSPTPNDGPVCRRISVSASVAGEHGLVSCVLPEELLVDIIAERLQLNDCYQGVIFDGLETLFSTNYHTALIAVLKAINKRRHVYFISQKMDYNVVRERQLAKEEENAKCILEKEEERKIQLDEMDEDEYDALSEEEKEEIEKKILESRKARIKREMEERHERDRIEREKMALMEEKRIEEENQKKKNKKGKREEPSKRSISGKHEISVPTSGKEKGSLKTIVSVAMVGQSSSHEGLDKLRPESRIHERPESEDGKKIRKRAFRPVSDDEGKEKLLEEPIKEESSETELQLLNRFKAFDRWFKDISSTLQHWDRTSLTAAMPSSPDGGNTQGILADEDTPQSGKKGSKKEREKERLERQERERLEKEKADRERIEREKADKEKQEGTDAAEDASIKHRPDEVGIPHLILDANDPEEPCYKRILELNLLPRTNEVLDCLGLGPKGPPIPPPALFCVVPFPVTRKAPSRTQGSHFELIASSYGDATAEEGVAKEMEIPPLEVIPPELNRSDSKKEEHLLSQAKDKKKREVLRTESMKIPGVRRVTSRRGTARAPSDLAKSSLAPALGSESDPSSGTSDTLRQVKSPKLNSFRWTVPAFSEVVIRIQFSSNELGQFDQTLSFELTGTRKRYQLLCKGVCAFPTISREPRIVFSQRRKAKTNPEDIIAKKYLLHEEIYEFGPLLCGKTRERYKEGNYPENAEKISMLNTSPLAANLSFSFFHDNSANTFLLDPPNMVLEPNESQQLSIWAYPKSAGRFLDKLVCCIRENPEPICFNISCHGVRPELELDKKYLHFDKVLLHRKDTRSVCFKNATMLPVAWSITGMENMGDDFTLNQDCGTIEPHCEFNLQLHFRATKASNIKKAIRLEVSDVCNIMGLVQTENIQVTAEAYDVALDMSFPKGTDGGLDFGTLRVQDETKQACSLKNKGKYEIAFNFIFEPQAPGCPPTDSLFSVIPQKGTLVPNDRPTQMQVVFRSQTEVSIRDYPLLKCEVIEPAIGDGNEVIACIPIRLSVRSVFSKYSIFPNTDINFGPMVISSKKSRSISIENKGEFDFKYCIGKVIREALQVKVRAFGQGGKRNKSRDGSDSERSAARIARAASLRHEVTMTNQARLVVGPFTIYPGYGTILPGATHNVTIDCLCESTERVEEFLAIDVTDRDPYDHTANVPYRVVCEGCVPSINSNDFTSVFEEHRICKNLNVYLRNKKIMEGGGVYGEEDNKFLFCNVIVGRKAFARFKISNPHKVSVDISITVKPISNKQSARIHDIFDVDISKAQIPPHGFLFATVTFTPPAMNTYTCCFEATVEGISTSNLKNRSLSFDISGEGNLPRVTVIKPFLRNKKGEPLLLFQRLLLNRSATLPLVVINEGSFPSKVNMILDQQVEPDDGSNTNNNGSTFPEYPFTLVPHQNTETCVPMTLPGRTSNIPYTASVLLAPDETAGFDVVFKPANVKVYRGQLKITVVDNQFEEHRLQLYGEGFKDCITLDNIRMDEDMATFAGENGVLDTAELTQQPVDDQAQHRMEYNGEVVLFGDCEIGIPKTRTFSLSNHSTNLVFRFNFEDNANFKFIPSVGHLHPGTTKEMSVTFKSDQPTEIKKLLLKCSISKILLSLLNDQVTDWDDRMRVVKWLDVLDSSKPKAKPTKKKFIEIESEPDHTISIESRRQLELFVSAKANYAKFSCDTSTINFKDTLMYRSRVYEFSLKNEGSILLSYTWRVDYDGCCSRIDRTYRRPSSATHSAGSVGVDSSLRSMLDDSMMPFSVAPLEGKIKPGDTQKFSVRFLPPELTDFSASLLCSIENLDPDLQAPSVALVGRSLMPFCHFAIEDSDYISSGRRNSDLSNPGSHLGSTLDPNTRVIEFNAIGIDTKRYKKFWIMNPTSNFYNFRWVCLDAIDAKVPSKFACHFKEGLLSSGRKMEVSFSFSSSKVEVCESFWKFHILEQNISIPFLLVGHTSEPQVVLSVSHLNFKSLLVGRRATDTIYLINNEAIDFKFEVSEDSCYSEGRSCSLDISPAKGILLGNSRVALQVGFTAKVAEEVNFNALIKINRKLNPLTLNVKAHGNNLSVQLLCENSQGFKVQLSPVGLNAINLGEVEVREKSARQFHLVNNGKYNFSFNWNVREITKGPSGQILKLNKKPAMNVSPESGIVHAGTRKRCVLLYHPKKVGPTNINEMMLKITDGPSFLCHVSAISVNPGLEFSTKFYNFGTCFTYKAGMPPNTTKVQLTNKDYKEISVECLYQNTSYLEVTLDPIVLLPGKCAFAHVTFYPRESTSYNETVTFLINGLSKHDVVIKGGGTEMRVEVAKAKQKTVKLGALRIMQSTKQVVPIINRSSTSVTMTLSFNPITAGLQDSSVLKILPTEPITLAANGGTKTVEVHFAPKNRIPAFSEEVIMECEGITQPLFFLAGSCHDIQITLDQDSIPFGAVVLGSQSERRFLMQNTGDIGARFQWPAEKFTPDFSICPITGYISPGMEVPFNLCFHPRDLSPDIRYEGIKCAIEGGKALKLTLTGMCIGTPPLKETLSFVCHVRSRDARNIAIPNRSAQRWYLQPVIDGEHWSGPDAFTVEPQQSKHYEIVYKPMSMTTDGKKHQGSVFFPLPDGGGLLYNLQGQADPPKPVLNVTRDVPCKTAYVELLPVTNWLRKSQRFKVIVELIKPEKLDPGTTLKGLDYIDVPGSVKRDYKLNFFAHKEGNFGARIVFKNERCGEYLFFYVTFRATPPGTMASIELTTPVRRSIFHTIKVDNPLPYTVTFLTDCRIFDINIPPQFSVAANSEGSCIFEYLPLKVTDTTGKLILTHNDLGNYTYDLILKATPAGKVKKTYFKTGLGGNQVVTIKFQSYARQKSDYSCKIDSHEWSCEKSLIATPSLSGGGTEITLDVTYEPVNLGQSQATLLVTSVIGGEYVFPLEGKCEPPKPQGPFVVRNKLTVSIPFRNVFHATTQYTLQVDNPLFSVKSVDSIRAKKNHNISVIFDGATNPGSVVTGKLTMTCMHPTGGAVSWIFYLKGVTPEQIIL